MSPRCIRNYEGCSEMIWTQLTCRNCIIFTLNTKQLLDQHIPLLGYSSLPSPRQLLDGFMKPFFRGGVISFMDTCAISLPLLKLCTQLNTVPHAGAFSPQIADNRWISDGLMPPFQRNHMVHLCLIFCNSCPHTLTTRPGNDTRAVASESESEGILGAVKVGTSKNVPTPTLTST
jgi:hypothetical protein